MPTFKPKNIKHIIISKKSGVTLDSKHNTLLKSFTQKNNEIPKLKSKRSELVKQYNSDTSLTIDEKLDIKDIIKDIAKQITAIKREKKEYLLNNSKYIFEYFENKKKISEGSSNTKKLNSFFNIKNESEEKKEVVNSNVHKYLTNVDEDFLEINNYITQIDICQYCKLGEMIPVDYEGILVCNNCSKSIRFLVENEKPSYKEPPKEVCFYAYKRINHFREILAQFQAKETTQIPDIVLENIKSQIKKERITLEQISNKKAKEILKKLGYNKYYEHIPFIKDKLGIKPPIMGPELEETLCNLFMDIQEPYAKYCPDSRVNFLNYYYTVYKLCELLDQREFLPFFPMLKDREKRIEQDEIWKKICEELDWEFIPTI